VRGKEKKGREKGKGGENAACAASTTIRIEFLPGY